MLKRLVAFFLLTARAILRPSVGRARDGGIWTVVRVWLDVGWHGIYHSATVLYCWGFLEGTFSRKRYQVYFDSDSLLLCFCLPSLR